MTSLISRTYRITKDQDKAVKKLSVKLSKKGFKVSESNLIRQGIDKICGEEVIIKKVKTK